MVTWFIHKVVESKKMHNECRKIALLAIYMSKETHKVVKVNAESN